jgi:hypothetical protein
MLRSFASAMLFAAFATAASAQTPVVAPAARSNMPASGQQVRITVAVSAFVPAPTNDSDQSLKAQESGRRKVYQLAARECGILRAILASDCRLESININVQPVSANSNFGRSQVEGFNINGNVFFSIVTK